MSSLVGKYVIIAYNSSPNFMLDKAYKVVDEADDSIDVQIGSRQSKYWKSAVLGVYDTIEDAAQVISMNHEYLKVCAANRERENAMRDTIRGFIKHFSLQTPDNVV
ncbi:hypothetical protein HYQ22_gp123 [Acinetobacter phage vB_AbaM_Kimel]|uniref:Uncharacterized protein n=3 Tax=Lazarusvirus kimel TaxID=2843635 RepID=A0A6B9LQ71_9CAUD|nr:hypothetical protein HYQ22_gp123 [Acinetobacter phage vB_AbaM_Kimel]QHB48278.1 hypothetical protein Kimel_123 [Acinetobacter phage vB_AbaM_Kimel]QKE55821.1 hypothetical protein Octan_119 [Acinetobacter phage Octan]QNO11240.1 hypothetical protein Meroveus_119 [Acinetobacter phage Meroveus]